MLYKTGTILGFVAAASAYANPAHVAVKLQARQTDVAGITACASALLEFATLVPTPPPEVVSWAVENPITDACDWEAKVPASLAPAISSYQTVALSFLSAQSSKLVSLVSICPDVSSALSVVEQATLTCGDSGSSKTGSASASATAGTGSGSTPAAGGAGSTGTKTGGAGATGQSTAGGARETGFVGAAIAAAGFLGVVAVL
ncbi:hypothetical protein B0T16DRAFT_390269 [Cercophora newfieldiana]|uniref:Infection structure specific protein n=1 Tax=Cercophora newfieldiana TaxID=92897 RepID=A0AA39Y734_9PEZI|nr:hypothetical protein B0T16DRAFT_390269 [Cercophora newfieldiana]